MQEDRPVGLRLAAGGPGGRSSRDRPLSFPISGDKALTTRPGPYVHREACHSCCKARSQRGEAWPPRGALPTVQTAEPSSPGHSRGAGGGKGCGDRGSGDRTGSPQGSEVLKRKECTCLLRRDLGILALARKQLSDLHSVVTTALPSPTLLAQCLLSQRVYPKVTTHFGQGLGDPCPAPLSHMKFTRFPSNIPSMLLIPLSWSLPYS